MPAARGLITRVTVIKVTAVVSGVATAVVIGGGTAAWLLERDVPGSTFGSWGDTVWWAFSTLTTVGYGDHVPVTTAGRLVAAVVMMAGVGVIGGVAAGIALIVARAEEQALEAEAESLERRLESRLDGLQAQLARIEAQLRSRERPDGEAQVPAPSGERAEIGRTPDSRSYSDQAP